MKAIPYSEADILDLGRTLWGEARGESREGQIAVAWVIRNRAENPGWWSRQKGDGIPDDTIEAVCRDPDQFSCWWDSQAPRVRSRTVASLGELMRIARDVLEGVIHDPTNGADHYHTIAGPEWARVWPPKWAQGKAGKTVGRHIFYRLGLRGDW